MNKRNTQKNGLLPIVVLIVAVLIVAVKLVGLSTDSNVSTVLETTVESTDLLTEAQSTPNLADGVEATTADTVTIHDETTQAETSQAETSQAETIQQTETKQAETTRDESILDESSYYYKVKDVALYLHTYGHLPPNYITKDEAAVMGWVSEKGNLWDVADGMVIGGDYFGNYEGSLPEASGRKYYECDVNYNGGYRDANRIVFSNDGLIYYTDDHYKTFKKLY